MIEIPRSNLPNLGLSSDPSSNHRYHWHNSWSRLGFQVRMQSLTSHFPSGCRCQEWEPEMSVYTWKEGTFAVCASLIRCFKITLYASRLWRLCRIYLTMLWSLSIASKDLHFVLIKFAFWSSDKSFMNSYSFNSIILKSKKDLWQRFVVHEWNNVNDDFQYQILYLHFQ